MKMVSTGTCSPLQSNASSTVGTCSYSYKNYLNLFDSAGWWFVSAEDGQGWTPSSYLERADGVEENTATPVDNPGNPQSDSVICQMLICISKALA